MMSGIAAAGTGFAWRARIVAAISCSSGVSSSSGLGLASAARPATPVTGDLFFAGFSFSVRLLTLDTCAEKSHISSVHRYQYGGGGTWLSGCRTQRHCLPKRTPPLAFG
jgi:hypothetical protein